MLSHMGLSSPDENKRACLPVVWVCIRGNLLSAVVFTKYALCCARPRAQTRVFAHKKETVSLNTQENTIKRVGGRMLQMAMLLCMGMLTVGHRKGKPAGGGQDFFPLGLCSLTGSQEDAGRPANRQTDGALMHNSLKGQGQGYSCYTSLQCCFNFPLVYNESPSL